MISEDLLLRSPVRPTAPDDSAPTHLARRGASSHRPGRVTSDHVIATFALTLLTVVTAIGMCRVFADWEFLGTLVVTAIVVHAAALGLRVLRVHAILAIPFGALVLYETIAVQFYRDTVQFGLPSRGTFELISIDTRLVWSQFPTTVAPVSSSGGYLVAATLAIGLVALLSDSFAFRAYGRAEAVVPSGVLFIFMAALGTDRNRISVAAAWLAAALLVIGMLRALHGGVDESWLGRRGRAMGAAVPAAGMIAVVAAIAATIAGPRLPGAGAEPLLDTHRGQADVTEVVSPLVDIRSRLVNRSDTEMFTVDASAGRYWRLTGLSEFDGTSWGLPDRTLESADGTLNDQITGAALLQQRITISRLGGTLIPAAFAPVSISQRGVLWLPGTDTLVLDDETFHQGDVFNISSTDTDPGPDVLRAATASSPPTSEFFDLPADFPTDVTNLARAVTSGAGTPYDQALALQNYFRTNFTYDLTVQKGHSEDAILSFLRIKRGYCEQFSATFAAMARSIGLPARVAVGFTQGQLEPDGKFHVLGKHAHAWPEVWFDGIGWVLFEPTPGRGAPGAESSTGVAPQQDETPAGNGQAGGAGEPAPSTTIARVTPTTEPNFDGRPAGQAAPTVPPRSSSTSKTSGSGIGPIGWIMLALLALGAWMAAMPTVIARFTRRGSTPSEQVIAAWHGTVGSLMLAGAPPPLGTTPLEYAGTVESRLAVDYRSLVELARFVTRAVYAPNGVGAPAALRAQVLQTHLQQSSRDITPWTTRLRLRLDPRLVRQRLVGDLYR